MASKSEEVDKINDSSSEEDIEMQSDSESDDSDDAMSEEVVKALQQKVKKDPHVYEYHTELITALRKTGDLEKLRSARARMHEIFPLTPDLWLQWIGDESKVMSTAEERDKVEQLYNKALHDYQSPEVWLEFVQFAISDMTRKGIQHPRDVFERALSSVGLHVTAGSIIWQAYREYETAVLAGLQPLGSILTPEKQEDINRQTKLITNLLKRQLAVPHRDIEATFEEYEEFCDEIDPEVMKTYEKTKQKLSILEPFEKALEKADPPRTEAYKSYIKHELQEGDPSRIQCIFERALIENCLQADFWIKYGKYLDLELRSRSAILKMYRRAVKNCPYSADLWLLHLRALERFQYQSHDLIKGQFDKLLASSNLSSGEDFLKLWTAYCDYMRRRIDWERQEQETKIEELRNTFQEATEFLMTNFGKDGDANCTLLQYRARQEAKFCKSMEHARECWNQIMQQGFGNQYQMWLEYFNLERAFGDHKHCRKILQRALNSVTDWPEYLVELFLNFEREEGTLEQFEQALERCDAQMKRIAERKAKEQEVKDISKWCKMSIQKGRKGAVCSLCHKKGHEMLTYNCDALHDPPLENVTPFKGKLDVLSNFYPCKLMFEGMEYASTEHLYQYYKAMENGREDLAEEILLLNETRDVKLLSKNIVTDTKWKERKVSLFDEILAAKLLYCPEYARALLDAKEIIAEAVPGDKYWSTGLSKEEIIYTKVECWPGQNVMGKMHMKLREIIKRNLGSQPSTPSSVPKLSDLCQPKAALKEGRVEEDINQKKARGFEKQKQDRQKLQKIHQKQQQDRQKGQQERQIQQKLHPSGQPAEERQIPKEEPEPESSSPSKTDSEGFKVPSTPPPGFKPVAATTSKQETTSVVKPPPGYKRSADEEKDTEPPEKKQKVEQTDPVRDEGNPSVASEKCKVFVSNLRFSTKESDLTPIFIQYGDLKDIRLVKQGSGKIRGFGYVEYRQEASAKAALALDRHELDGRPIYVSECKPNKQDRGTFKFATEMEKCKLFVRNLPLSLTKEALLEIFSKHGTVKDARLVTHKSGAPKGLAYVEYFEEEVASKAIMQLDGLKVGEHEISVAISNPPGRKAQLNPREQPTTTYQPSLGGGKKEADRGGRAKTMLAFQPRSVQNKPKPTAVVKPGANPGGPVKTDANDGQNGASSSTEAKSTRLSNADFRSMLLKK